MSSLFDYTAWGPHDGPCGHRHRSQTTARRCLRNGGDRRLYEITSGDPIDPPPGANRLDGVAPFQERLAASPWKLLVACVLANRTDGRTAERITGRVFDRWPDAPSLAAADPETVADVIDPVGMAGRKSEYLVAIADNFVLYASMRGRGLDLPWPPPPTWVSGLPGVGEYAVDSYRIFVLGERDLEPRDRVLSAWLERDRQDL